MQPDHPAPRALPPTALDWQDGIPVSPAFGDLYFSREDGPAETRHVFLEQNALPARWQDWRLPGSFVIGETGFGTGLNFLCAWQLWQQTRQPGQHLHFISLEKFPLDRDALAQAARAWPALAPLAERLREQYPPRVQGRHRLHFPGEQLTLTLIFDDAIAGLAAQEGRVDAWFLDGFAPACNPEMWQPALFAEMARLSGAGTTLATFTAAGEVKRGLQAAGFQVEKCNGFGRKREMLKGVFTRDPEDRPQPPAQKPWLHARSRRTPPGQAAVIGAGMAGCAAARALAERGWQVTLIDAEDDLARQGSANPTAVTYTRLSAHDSPQNRYYQFAYLHACRFLRAFLPETLGAPGTDWNLNGLLQLAWDANEKAEQDQVLASGVWPAEVVEGLTAEQLSALTGFACPHPGLRLQDGGWLNPARLCRALSQHPLIRLHTGLRIDHFEHRDGGWYLNGLNDCFQTVVLANNFDANQHDFSRHLILRPIRGQISYVPATSASTALRHAINYDGYLTPAWNGFHCAGATFDAKSRNPRETPEDHRQNLSILHDTWPALATALHLDPQAAVQGRVGFRCQTPDFLPIIGPLPDPERFRAVYADIGKGHLKRDYDACPYLPGLYVSTGHGSKGVTSSLLAGEILAGYVSGEPQPVDRDVLHATHPARFLFRAIKRRQG